MKYTGGRQNDFNIHAAHRVKASRVGMRGAQSIWFERVQRPGQSIPSSAPKTTLSSFGCPAGLSSGPS